MRTLLEKIFHFIRHHKFIFIVLFVAFWFRYYRVSDFQFWSTDEEIIAHFVRKVIDEKRLFLVSPNFSLGISLGSAFFLLSSIPYWFANLDPTQALYLTSIIGLITTGTLYLVGKNIHSVRLGFFSSFLYGASFLASLNDRRWWTLSVAPLLTALTIFSLNKLSDKKYWYFTLLAICVMAAWQIDPNFGILPIMAIVTFIAFHIPIIKRQYILGVIICLMSLSPLIFFEFRHPGTITTPFIKLLTKSNQRHLDVFPITWQLADFLARIPTTYAYYFAVEPNVAFDGVFNWVKEPQIVATPIPQVIILSLALFSLIWVWKYRKSKSRTKNGIVMIWLCFGVFLASLFISRVMFGLIWRTYYFHVSLPLICLILAFGMETMYQSRKFITYGILGVFLLINIRTLVYSNFRYPLKDKWKLVKELKNKIPDEPFRLKTIAEEDFVHHGFSGLFVLARLSPHKSDEYDALDWWMRAHSLYFVDPDSPAPLYTVIISGSPVRFPSQNIEYSTQVGVMHGLIYNSRK